MKCFTAPYRFSMEARQPERRGHYQAAAPEFGAKLLTMERQHPRALKVQQAYQRRYYGLPRERARPTFVTKSSEERHRNLRANSRLSCQRCKKQRWQARIQPKWGASRRHYPRPPIIRK